MSVKRIKCFSAAHPEGRVVEIDLPDPPPLAAPIVTADTPTHKAVRFAAPDVNAVQFKEVTMPDGTVQKFAGGYSLDAILRAIGGPEA